MRTQARLGRRMLRGGTERMSKLNPYTRHLFHFHIMPHIWLLFDGNTGCGIHFHRFRPEIASR